MMDADVVVIGGGNAGLCAALAAAETGARVTLVERAGADTPGGNSFVTAGAFRFPYRGFDDVGQIVTDPNLVSGAVDVGAYTEDDFLADMRRLTGGKTDPQLSRALVSRAFPTMTWLRSHGVEFVLAYDRQSFLVDGRHRFWGGLIVKTKGEGPGLIGALLRACEVAGVTVHYESRATTLARDEALGQWLLQVAVGSVTRRYRARAVVLACGGFEANPQMRLAHLGPRWQAAKVRGTRYNTGDGIQMALAAGAQPFGDWGGCHAVAWDAKAPPSNDERLGQHFERDSYPLGIYVNLRGERFVDEGADFRNYTYARYGQEIIRQPQSTAFQIFDQKVIPLLRKPYSLPGTTRVEASTIAGLARGAGIDAGGLERTIAAFNAAVDAAATAAAPAVPFNPAVKDGKAARGITPPKSNWAQRIDTPPLVCFPVTCGITFTFGGLKVTADAEVVGSDGRPLPGLFACGELVGGLFYENYPGGSGLMSGAVFGRTAGTSARAFAR